MKLKPKSEFFESVKTVFQDFSKQAIAAVRLVTSLTAAIACFGKILKNSLNLLKKLIF